MRHILQSQGAPLSYNLRILRRQGSWATTLPHGAFGGDFGAGDATLEYQRAFDAARGPRRLRPFPARLDPVERDGLLYHRLEAVRLMRDHVARPAFLSASYRFLLRAVDHPDLVVPPRQPRFVPFADRQRVFSLRQPWCRGPAWSPDEDLVLRRWFGMRTAGPGKGRHGSLSPEQWERVMVELDHRRTAASVQSRIRDLNKALLAEFAVDGLVPRTRLAEYMSRALGERPRVPPVGGRRPAPPRPPPTAEQRAALLARLPPMVRWTDAEDAVALAGQVPPGRTAAAARQRACALRRRRAEVAA